ncbi:MAG TPA: ABC transporter permease [bacterium]|nr:ABC transporter permease [bacterium]
MSLTGTLDPADRTVLDARRRRRRYWRRLTRDPVLFFGMLIVGVVVCVAALAPAIAPRPYDDELPARRLLAPFSSYNHQLFVLGTDQLGRDVLSRIIYGARVSILVGTVGVVTGAVLGVGVGLVGGWFEDWRSTLLMRLADIQLSFPYLLLAIAVMAVLGPSLLNLVIVLGLRTWVGFARVVRGSVLATKPLEFIEAAQATGAATPYILLRHILPNVIGPIIVLVTLEFANLILLEATLSFLGLGVQPPFPSWGTMLSEARDYLFTDWWLSIPPGVAIMLTVLGANLLGDGLRDILDPKLM